MSETEVFHAEIFNDAGALAGLELSILVSFASERPIAARWHIIERREGDERHHECAPLAIFDGTIPYVRLRDDALAYRAESSTLWRDDWGLLPVGPDGVH